MKDMKPQLFVLFACLAIGTNLQGQGKYADAFRRADSAFWATLKYNSMYTEDYCSYELSKKLKEAGFDLDTHRYYGTAGAKDGLAWCEYSRVAMNYNMGRDDIYSAPTLYQAQKWLREVHRVHVQVWWNDMHGCYFADVIHLETNYISNVRHEKGNSFYTYEAALEAGINAALDFVIKNK